MTPLMLKSVQSVTSQRDASRIDVVAGAIESHSYSAGKAPTSLEGCILQDSDRLDAIGYVGIARCFYTAGRMGSVLYDPLEPKATIRALDDRQFALDHFPNKLLKLSENFWTSAGRRLATERQQTLEVFYCAYLLRSQARSAGWEPLRRGTLWSCEDFGVLG